MKKENPNTKDMENLLNEDYNETMNDKIKTTNPYSGESTMLTQTEYNMYSNIKHAEFLGEYKEMQTMLDKFSRLNPKAYMVLLD